MGQMGKFRNWLFGAVLAFVPCAAQATEVVIRGLSAKSDLLEAITAGSLLVEQSKGETKPSAYEVVAAAQADYRRLLALMYDNGYFGPTISIKLDGREAVSVPPVQPPSHVKRAVVTIDAGPVFRFGQVRIAPTAAGTELPPEFATGEIARLSVLKDSVASGVNGWREQGHAKAKLARQNLTANHPKRQVSANLTLAAGPQLRFGDLIVQGNDRMSVRRIRKIAGLPTGRVFSPKELERAANRLRRTGVFSSVALIEADQIGLGQTLPITAQLAEAAPRRIGFGAEISSLEGLTLSGYWLHRNLWGGAERLRFDAEISGIGGNSGGEDYSLAARFDRPATFNEDTNFYALASLKQLDEVNFFSRQLDLEAGIERFANENRTYTLGLGLRRAKTRDVFGMQQYSLLTFPLSAEFDYRNAELDATSGYYAKADLVPFVSISGADNGLRARLDLRYYRSFGDVRPVTLAVRGQLGSVYGPRLSAAPADYLFYSGGGGTVRGQPYQALGVDIGGGDVVGGRSFVGLSAEARFKLGESFGLVGFADAGYIGAEEFYDGTGQWHSGAGLGLRYDTGIGPIRLDMAVPTSGPKTDENFQVYIGIGQAF